MEKSELNRGVMWGSVLKSGIFALVALGVLVGNFFYEGGFETALPEVAEVDELLESRILLRFEGAEATLAQRKEEEVYVFDLKEGRVWANLTAATEEVRFELADKLAIEANRAVFDLQFEENEVEIRVYDGDLYLNFLGDELSEASTALSGNFDPHVQDQGTLRSKFPSGLVSTSDNSSPVFGKREVLNSLLLPRASSLRINLRKVDSKLAPLLPDKLRKEFFYAALGDDEDEFVKDNLAKDKRFFDELKRDFRSELAREGVELKGGVIDQVLASAAANLTFVPEKKRELQLNEMARHLDNALSYANAGNETKMKEELLAFKALRVDGEDLQVLFEDYLDRLAIFNVADSEYPVYLALLEANDLKGEADLLRVYWFNVYKGVDAGTVTAQSALDLYLEKFDVLLSEEDENYQQYLREQNQLFDNLFLRFPLFYRDGYFALKDRIEKELLTFYEGQAAEELTQSFIDQKIDFLKRLRSYFFDGEVEVAEAKKIFKRLMTSAKELLPQEGGSVAVIELFEQELSDIEDFWGYLSSPDYQTKFYGSTHEERYEAYLAEREQVFDFSDLQEGVFGEVTEVAVSLAELEEKILEVLAAEAEISDVKVVAEDLDARYLAISAVVGGYPFEALFDRDTEVLSEVYVYGEEVSSRPVAAAKLFGLIAQKFGDLAEETDVESAEEEDLTVESVAQRRARLYVAEVLGELGLAVSINDVSTVSATEAIYRVSEVFLADTDEAVRASFEILMNGEIVRGLFITVSGEPQLLSGEFTLEELKLILEAEVQFLADGKDYDAEVLLGRKKEEGKVKR